MKKVIGMLFVIALCAVLIVACESSGKVVVTLDPNYDGGKATTEYTDTTTVYTPSTQPTRSGYFFRGWYYDSECTKKYTPTTLKSNTTLYADWEKELDNVTFKCIVNLASVKLEEKDVVDAVATYKSGSQSGSDEKTKVLIDTLMKSIEISLDAKTAPGKIEVLLKRSGKVVGKGSTDVAMFKEGETYTVNINPAD